MHIYNLSNKLFKHVLIIITLSFCVFSCSKDNDDDQDSETISFRVNMTKINALDIKDAEENALEIYGIVLSSLNVGTTTDERTIWEISEDDYLSVDFNDQQLSGSVTFTIAEQNVSDSTITIEANLTELDFSNPDDNIGVETSMISLNSITDSEEFQISFTQSGGQHVSLSYRITKL